MTASHRSWSARRTLALVLTNASLVAAPAAACPGDAAPPLPAARHGDHPDVVVQRLHRSAGYDFASKFYLHPAQLHLLAEPPHDPPHDGAVATADELGR
jgi:hypothetical protein